MYEKRRSKRLEVELHLEISSLFKQDNVKVTNINEPIEVFNVSKSGIGFKSKSELPIGYYFNACIQLGGPLSRLYTVVKIIRKEETDQGYTIYGCEFVGMASVLNYVFDEYEAKINELDKTE